MSEQVASKDSNTGRPLMLTFVAVRTVILEDPLVLPFVAVRTVILEDLLVLTFVAVRTVILEDPLVLTFMFHEIRAMFEQVATLLTRILLEHTETTKL